MQTNSELSPELVIVIKPIEWFVPYTRNPRRNDEAVDRMCAAIREFGFKIPVLAKSDGTVVDGHLRLKAAQKLSLRELPAILCDEWDDAKVRAFRLLVNRSVGWAEWNTELLRLELEDLKSYDYNLNLTGFDARELESFLRPTLSEEAENAVPPVPEDPV